MSILGNIIAFIAAIGLLVAVHEYGHFWVARRLGIRVLRFSIGFGRPIWRRMLDEKDPVEFVIATIPLGGYVKLLDEREGPVPEGQRHRAFNRAPIAKRMAVLVAGPLFNFLFAIVAFWLVAVLGQPALMPLVGDVRAGSPAAHAGLVAGDRIVSVAGRTVESRQQALIGMLDDMLDDGLVSFAVQGERGPRELIIDVAGQQRRLSEPGELLDGLGFAFTLPEATTEIGEAIAGHPAERAGLETGDVIVAIDGVATADWPSVVQAIESKPGRHVRFDIEREGEGRLAIDVALASADGPDGLRGQAGIRPRVRWPAEVVVTERHGPIGAVGVGIRSTWEYSALTVRMLGRMLTGHVSIKNISGPISIAEFAGQTARFGIVPFASFLAIISISLGVLNLLPIPILDGGQLLYQLIELVKGSPLSEKSMLLGQQIGIVILLLLMSFAFYNDIVRLAG